MHDFCYCGVKQESDYLHHGSGGVRLDADSKFNKQDRMRSQKNRIRTPLGQPAEVSRFSYGNTALQPARPSGPPISVIHTNICKTKTTTMNVLCRYAQLLLLQLLNSYKKQVAPSLDSYSSSPCM